MSNRRLSQNNSTYLGTPPVNVYNANNRHLYMLDDNHV